MIGIFNLRSSGSPTVKIEKLIWILRKNKKEKVNNNCGFEMRRSRQKVIQNTAKDESWMDLCDT